ncbi:MAG: hypothetical protein WCR27_07815 [Eubacteriales bacterium]
MEAINFGVGFFTGRANVCSIINSYYENMLTQLDKSDKKIQLTLFVLYDLEYLNTTRTKFYNTLPEVYRDVNIRYITPELIEEEKKKITSRSDFTIEDLDLVLGNGYAKGRNTLMYYASKWNIDYMLFWDDDEYPVANVKNGKNIDWVKQNNLYEHIKNISDCDITIGHHCGYVSPIPYVDFEEDIEEEYFKDFIGAVSNDILSWESVKEKMQLNNGFTYADRDIANGIGLYEIERNGGGKWVAGSTLCVNLKNLRRIPAFYTPPDARGEDTFFATSLDEQKVLRVPVYHFHDCFLRYRTIMEGKYPKVLERTENNFYIGKRFFEASLGWVRYKPLLMYITDRENFNSNFEEVMTNLKRSVAPIGKMYPDFNFKGLVEEFQEYSDDVDKHFKEYVKTNEIWTELA